MNILKRLTAPLLLATVLLLPSLDPVLGQPAENETREPLQITVTENVRAAYEATEDNWQNGIAKPLYRLKKFLTFYREHGVERSDLSLNAIFQGDAGYWMLTDESYNQFKDTQEGNPNKDIIQELVEAGVSIELCSQTMKHNGWTKGDVLPSVLIVHDAYSRLVDLQMRDYAYIRF